MTTKLNRIKSALRESIEIASKATKEPWATCNKADMMDYGDPIRVVSTEPPFSVAYHGSPNCFLSAADATFISHARTMTPLACKALLTAIEGLEILAMTTSGEAYNTLSSITSEWPDV